MITGLGPMTSHICESQSDFLLTAKEQKHKTRLLGVRVKADAVRASLASKELRELRQRGHHMLPSLMGNRAVILTPAQHLFALLCNLTV